MARVDTADRMTFATGTNATHTDADASTPKSQQADMSDNDKTYGYVLSGATAGVVSERMTFATSTLVAHTDANTVENKSNMGGMGDGNGGYGYLAGAGWGAEPMRSERMTFSTGVLAVHTDVDLSYIRAASLAISDGSV